MTEGPGFDAPDAIAGLDYARDLGDPGTYPFTRGQAPSRRGGRSWVHRELSGEGSPARSNEQLRHLLEHGAVGLDVIGDAPTVGLFDPDHPYARHSVGTQGVSICRLDDFAQLYDGIDLANVSISHSLPAAFTVAGLYLTARRRSIDPALLRGSVINAPFFMEDYGYATLLPFEMRLRMALDTIEFATREMPRFHPFVEDTYFISDGGPGPVDEMALGFVELREVVRSLIARGLHVDEFAPRFVILVNCRMEVFTEIAKIRATRRMYAQMMREEFGARDPRSWSATITVHTSGASMTAQQPVNNVARGAVQAFAMAAAGVKAMEISAFDEALRTPSPEAHMVGLRTQQIIELETDVQGSADPLGGSYYVERLTNQMEEQIYARIREFESAGPPAQLFESGYYRSVFTEAMERHGREIADGERPHVGVNCFSIPHEDDVLLREASESKIAPDHAHAEAIARWRDTRDQRGVAAALDRLSHEAAEDGSLMPAILDGLEADATIGEMAGAIRRGAGLPEDPLTGTSR